MKRAVLPQVAEKEAQRKELAQRCEALEACLAPLDADKAELAGRLQGLEKRAKEAEKARTDFEWRSRCALCLLKSCNLQLAEPFWHPVYPGGQGTQGCIGQWCGCKRLSPLQNGDRMQSSMTKSMSERL